jgi:hypothetical protein
LQPRRPILEMIKKALQNTNGQILLLVVIVVAVVLFSVVLTISGSQLYYNSSTYSLNIEKATALAEAGLDKAVASLNKTAGSYNGESETKLGAGSYSVTITNQDASTKLIEATGYIPDKATAKIKKTLRIQASKGVGVSFVYGMLVGNGGFVMGNGSTINGAVYSNGNISGGNNEIIAGDVFVAGGTQPTADQQNDCIGANCTDVIFGKNVGGNNQLSLAQSFKPNTSGVINKVSLKLKKSGSPANATVRILADNSGSPNKNTVLASAVLSANLATSQYGFVEVAFSSAPNVSANTSYWLMVTAASLDNSNYWYWQNDLATSYNRGVPKWSANWQASSPVWNAISGDLAFNIYMGGVATSIAMGNGSRVGGNVHANTISGFTIEKDAYYQIITNSTVNGTSFPASADPPPVAMPISEANILEWQSQAAAFGVTNSDVSGCPNNLGPGKINGNISIENNCTATVTTPIWITGNVIMGNSSILKLNSTLGSSSGVIIVDGITTFSNGNDLLGSGVSGSYLTLLSTYNSQQSGIQAVTTGNSSITGILYAPFGEIGLANNANFKEVVAWKISMGTGTILTYDFGLISTFFSTGPSSGSFSLVKGTYQTK